MSFSSIRQSIETYFDTHFSSTSVEYQNVPLHKNDVDEYVTVTIIDGESKQKTLGPDGEYVYPGIVLVQVFTKRGSGTARSRQIADDVSNIFMGLKLDSILFRVPQGKTVDNKTDYFQYNVSIPFVAYFNIT